MGEEYFYEEEVEAKAKARKDLAEQVMIEREAAAEEAVAADKTYLMLADPILVDLIVKKYPVLYGRYTHLQSVTNLTPELAMAELYELNILYYQALMLYLPKYGKEALVELKNIFSAFRARIYDSIDKTKLKAITEQIKVMQIESREERQTPGWLRFFRRR